MRVFLLLYLIFVAFAGLFDQSGRSINNQDYEPVITSDNDSALAPLVNLAAWVQRGESNLSSESEQRSSFVPTIHLAHRNLPGGRHRGLGPDQNHLLIIIDRVILYHRLLC
jgi:hypothetical protein